MLISHKHKYIFIKTKKTAGTSIEIALSKTCGEKDIITPISPADEIIRGSLGYRGPQNYLAPYQNYILSDWVRFLIRGNKPHKFDAHMSALEIRDRVEPLVWNSYFKFCFERNPWDKVISFYYWQYKTEPRPSLTEFITSGEAGLVSGDGGINLYTIDGRIVVDKIFRYETIETEVDELSKIIGLGERLLLPRAKSAFRQFHGCYTNLFSDQDRDEISRIFAREIDYLKYKF